MRTKSIFLITIIFIVINTIASAQNVITVEHEQGEDAFIYLDKSFITTGILSDKTIDFSNMEKYDGVFDTACDIVNWRQMYYEVYRASVNAPSLPSLEQLDEQAKNFSESRDAGRPKILWKKGETDGIDIYVDRKDGKGFIFLARDTTRSYKWLNLGAGSYDNLNYLNGGMNYNFDIRKNTFQAGYNFFMLHLNPDLPCNSYLCWEHTINTVNYSIGRRIHRRYYLAALFIGPSFNWGSKYQYDDADNEYIKMRYINAGIDGNVQFIFKPFPGIGIGTEVLGNLNSKESAWGISVVLHFSNDK